MDAGPPDVAPDLRDECTLGLDNCDPQAVCTDTPGGFTCTCSSQFVGDGVKCYPKSTTQAPSCAGMTGAECNGGSCCTSLFVPGGKFKLGGTVEPITADAKVSDFRLDKYEITVGRFRRFVEAYNGPPAPNAGAHPLIPNSGWQTTWNSAIAADRTALRAAIQEAGCAPFTWTDQPGTNEPLPLNCMTWYQAFAFCAWDGGRLPTEAEFEYAASGGSEQRLYPWGMDAPDRLLAVYDCTHNQSSSGDCSLSDIGPVGATPGGNGRWGHSDLGGSMWEWLLDLTAPYPPTCDNCANLTAGTSRMLRGGSWTSTAPYLRAAARTNGGGMGGAHVRDSGARCARPL
jgi:formylglycine-generating enzyme required for sulfatase activity